MSLRWRKVDPSIWVSETVRVWSKYNERNVAALFRVDARKRGAIRVDRGGVMGWEAIDDGRGFRTVTEAKRHAEDYLERIRTQQTLTPSRDRRRGRRRSSRRRSRRW